jgi:hypothetical protein
MATNRRWLAAERDLHCRSDWFSQERLTAAFTDEAGWRLAAEQSFCHILGYRDLWMLTAIKVSIRALLKTTPPTYRAAVGIVIYPYGAE